jgi:ABC-type multidrug transport system ATPase subunit
MSAAALSVTGLSRRYGAVSALEGVSLVLARSEVLGLIGPNGAGKTTLMRCLAGFEAADAGRIEFADGCAPREAVFYLPDGATPYPELTVSRVLALFAAAFGQAADAVARARIPLGLDAVADKPAGALSRGYRRRLLLAIALLAPQPLLLLDEPFDGLDVHQTRAVAALLRGLTETGRGLLVSVHQLHDAERVCDRFALLAEGRLLALGDLDTLRAQAGLSQGGLEEVFLALTEPALA